MLKIVIFGTGISMQRMVESINYNSSKIIVYLDNNEYKIGEKINGIEIVRPNKVNQYFYDFVIIASVEYVSITNQLLDLGVERNKIIQFYNFSFFLPRTFFFNDTIIKSDIFDKLFTDVYCSRNATIF